MNTQTIFQKELILVAFWRQNYYHKIKYIIFKSSSSKYNEVSPYYLYLIGGLTVYGNTSLDQQSISSQHYINATGSNQKSPSSPVSKAQRRRLCYLSQQHRVCVITIKQSCQSGVCVLTTSRSRRCGIQPITVADPAQPTSPITTAFSYSNSSSQSLSQKVLQSNSSSQELTSESLLRPLLVSSLHLPGRYHETTIQQPAPTSDQYQLNPAAVPVQLSNQHQL